MLMLEMANRHNNRRRRQKLMHTVYDSVQFKSACSLSLSLRQHRPPPLSRLSSYSLLLLLQPVTVECHWLCWLPPKVIHIHKVTSPSLSLSFSLVLASFVFCCTVFLAFSTTVAVNFSVLHGTLLRLILSILIVVLFPSPKQQQQQPFLVTFTTVISVGKGKEWKCSPPHFFHLVLCCVIVWCCIN